MYDGTMSFAACVSMIAREISCSERGTGIR